MIDIDVCIRYWLYVLELNNWDVVTQAIDRNQVVFPPDIEEENRYFIGIARETKEAVIYHDRELTEEDIVHELIHLKLPHISENMVNELTNLFLNASETEYPYV